MYWRYISWVEGGRVCVSEAHVMVVETVEMNSSSSPRLCIFNNFAIIATPAQQGGTDTTHNPRVPTTATRNQIYQSQSNWQYVHQMTCNLKFTNIIIIWNLPLLVRRTFSALLGSPSQEGVWASDSPSTHWTNCSRLHRNHTHTG